MAAVLHCVTSLQRNAPSCGDYLGSALKPRPEPHDGASTSLAAIFAGLAAHSVAVCRHQATRKRTWGSFGSSLVGDRPPPHKTDPSRRSNGPSVG